MNTLATAPQTLSCCHEGTEMLRISEEPWHEHFATAPQTLSCCHEETEMLRISEGRGKFWQNKLQRMI